MRGLQQGYTATTIRQPYGCARAHALAFIKLAKIVCYTPTRIQMYHTPETDSSAKRAVSANSFLRFNQYPVCGGCVNYKPTDLLLRVSKKIPDLFTTVGLKWPKGTPFAAGVNICSLTRPESFLVRLYFR